MMWGLGEGAPRAHWGPIRGVLGAGKLPGRPVVVSEYFSDSFFTSLNTTSSAAFGLPAYRTSRHCLAGVSMWFLSRISFAWCFKH